MTESRGLRSKAGWWLATLVVLAGVLAFALVRKDRRPDSATSEATTTAAELGGDAGGGAGAACETHATCAAGNLCTRGRCAPITAATTECREAKVRFARGTSALSSSAEAAIEGAARCFNAERAPRVLIEPSRDPTLDPDMNEALTEERVETVHRALDQRGVAREKLEEEEEPGASP